MKKIPRILCNNAIVYEHAWAAQQQCKKGSLIECGCFEGFNSAFLNFGLKKSKIEFTQYACDTFAGFPESYNDQGKYKQGDLAPAYGNDVVFSLLSLGIVVLRGDVKKTLFEIPADEQFFFVFLDLDVLAPTAFCWAQLHTRVLPGGRVGFHDYGAPALPGITKICEKIKKAVGWKEVFRPGRKTADTRFLFLEKQ